MNGKTIGHYRIDAELGRGGMGVVYKAEDTKLRRTVALKFLSPHLLADPQQKTRFLREAQAAAALDHPNISTIHEVHEADGQTFIVMAFIEGEDVQTKIGSGPMSIDEALDITVQVAKGLAKAHGEGIVHRDIKPGNVIVTKEGVAKVVDFGLAKLATQTKLTHTGTTVGTIRYMSPEQATGGEVDHRTDVWSLGVMLYEMLSGTLPFRGDVEQAILYSVLNEDPKPITETRKDIPVALEDTIEKALAKEPAKRFGTMEEFLTALETQRDQITLGIKERKFTAIRKLKRRKRLSATIAAVVVVGISAILAQTFYTRSMAVDSIAVLPFANLSGDEAQEYYSDGMTVALINKLQQVGALTVISRTSVMQFKDTEKSLPEIARELNVDAIIEASVMRDGDNVRITAQLIRANPERQMWAESYTRDASDVLSLHSEVARSIADRIEVALTASERSLLTRARPVDPEAHEAYLIGKSFVDKWTQDAVEKGILYLEQSLVHDPNYAQAHAGLATAYLYSASMGGGWRSPDEVIDKAREAAKRALALDESLAEAHTVLGTLSMTFDWDIELGERELKRAIELNPNLAEPRIAYAYLLRRLGGRRRFDEAFGQIVAARQSDPLHAHTRVHVIWAHLEAGDSAKVYEECQQLLDLNPEPVFQSQGILAKSFLAWSEGRMEDAVAGFERCVELTERRLPIELTFLGIVYETTGRHAEAMDLLNEIAALAEERYVSPVLFAQLYASMGNIDEAFESLERAYELRCSYLFDITPLFAQLGSDPRWDDLVKRVGLPDKAPLL
jgi:serine/threonine-protein kinase